MQTECDFEEEEVVVIVETPTPTPSPSPSPTPTPTPTPTPSPTPTPTPSPSPTPTPTPSPTPTPTPSPTPTPTPSPSPTPKFRPVVKQEDDNVISTPMYDTEDPSLKGPYYVPWKKTTMDLYNKLKKDEGESIYADTRYKSRGGYIEGSTIGNVPLKDDTDDKKDKSDLTDDKNKTN